MSIKLKSFDQFVAEMDRSEEIEQEVADTGAPEEKDLEEVEDEAEEVQESEESDEDDEDEDDEESDDEDDEESDEDELEEGNAFSDAVRKAKEAGEDEFEFDGKTYKVEEELDAIDESEETEEVEEVEEVSKSLAEALTEMYESSCVKEAKAYEEDAHDEHTVESYMKENAALVAGLMAKTLKEMKDDYAVEAYEAACNEMAEAYSKKMDEMKSMDSVEDAEDVE
jgi:hypothetical protein